MEASNTRKFSIGNTKTESIRIKITTVLKKGNQNEVLNRNGASESTPYRETRNEFGNGEKEMGFPGLQIERKK